MSGWTVTRLTSGTEEGRFHSHSYYDIPVIEPVPDAAGADGARVLAYETRFAERQPGPDDAVTVGFARLGRPDGFEPVARARAWSWQQGPMAQWAGADRFLYNDREGDRFVARLHEGEAVRTLPRAAYALSPDRTYALSLDFARLEALRPGYGYAGGRGGAADRRPGDEGVWRMPLDGAAPTLILSLDDAVRFLLGALPLHERLRHAGRRYAYWFNHAKFAPGGARFTVKLRWRRPGGPWNERMGVSLTCGTDGQALRLLTDATSHVMWLDDARLYAWRAGELSVWRDAGPEAGIEAGRGVRLGTLGGGLIDANVHLRHLPEGAVETPDALVYDTPYREDVTLYRQEGTGGARAAMATFTGHRPARGPFRCDLHPVPLPDGHGVLVTSLRDGGRQLYAVTRG